MNTEHFCIPYQDAVRVLTFEARRLGGSLGCKPREYATYMIRETKRTDYLSEFCCYDGNKLIRTPEGQWTYRVY